MLNPIVSMNKMAMNESIAVTCCFREVATPTAVYWEVLNGGWIGSGYVNIADWIDGFENAVVGTVWQQFGWDIDAGAATLSELRTGNKPQYGEKTIGATTRTDWWVLGLDNVTEIWASNASVTANGWNRGAPCNHTDVNCLYRFDINTHLANQHWDSKSAHGGHTAWQAPHTASRYNS